MCFLLMGLAYRRFFDIMCTCKSGRGGVGKVERKGSLPARNFEFSTWGDAEQLI
jgi:hypothetical protein